MMTVIFTLITNLYAASPDTIVCQYGSNKLLIQTHQKNNISLEYPTDSNQAKLFIKNTSEFSEVEDYLILKNNQGREVLFAITCKKI